jgi:hypothetical protein
MGLTFRGGRKQAGTGRRLTGFRPAGPASGEIPSPEEADHNRKCELLKGFIEQAGFRESLGPPPGAPAIFVEAPYLMIESGLIIYVNNL